MLNSYLIFYIAYGWKIMQAIEAILIAYRDDLLLLLVDDRFNEAMFKVMLELLKQDMSEHVENPCGKFNLEKLDRLYNIYRHLTKGK